MKKILAMLLVLAMTVCLFAACAKEGADPGASTDPGSSSDAPPPETGDSIKIGAIYPLTGSAASIGQNIVNSINMAVDEINEAGGIDGKPMEILWGDSEGDPSIGMSEAERLITVEGVQCLLGCYQSSVTEVVCQIAEKYQVPFVTAISAATSLTTHGYDYFYRMGLTKIMTAKDAMEFANFLSEQTGEPMDSFIIYTDSSTLGQELLSGCQYWAEEYGKTIVKEVVIQSDSTDVSAEIMTLMNTEADFIVTELYAADAILTVNTMAELNFKPKFFITLGAGYADVSFIPGTEGNNNGIYALMEYGSDSAKGVEASAKFLELYGTPMNGHACMGYTATYTLKNVIETAIRDLGGYTSANVKQALDELDYKDSTFPDGSKMIVPYDELDFGDTEIAGTAHHNLSLYACSTILQVQDGEYVSVWPEAAASTDIVYPATYD